MSHDDLERSRSHGAVSGDTVVRAIASCGDPGTTPVFTTANGRRFATYSATRLRFRREVVDCLGADDVVVSLIRRPTERSFWVAYTRREFETTFAHVLTTRSWRENGDYNYSRFPEKAERFIVWG